MFCFPAWIESPTKPIIIAGQTLLQTNGFIYILNSALVFFFSSHYAWSFGFRLLLIINNFNMVIRRWTARDAELLPILYNYILVYTFYEFHSYNLNVEKVKLFLEKEASKQKEQQKHTILHNMPTNVIVFHEKKAIFMNKQANELVLSIMKEVSYDRFDSEDASFDWTSCFISA
jgi:hypothetical protein